MPRLKKTTTYIADTKVTPSIWREVLRGKWRAAKWAPGEHGVEIVFAGDVLPSVYRLMARLHGRYTQPSSDPSVAFWFSEKRASVVIDKLTHLAHAGSRRVVPDGDPKIVAFMENVSEALYQMKQARESRTHSRRRLR